jgi:TonB family protein
MQQQRPKTEAGTSGYKDRRRMTLALVLLLMALVVVVVKNSEIWFGSDDASAADDTTTWVPSHAGQSARGVVANSASTNGAGSNAASNAAKTKSHVAVKGTTQPAVEGATVVAATRTVLPPLGIEVVAGEAHRSVHAVSNTVKVEMLPNSSVAATSEWGSATNAADRTRLTSASVQASSQPVGAYPLLAQQMKVQGSVLLQVLIAADGAIRDLRVLSGPAILASAARDAVSQWRFKPYLQNGHAVDTSANITVNFTIKVLDKATRDQLSPVTIATSGE